MPVVAFRPIKARLVIEQGRESVLVMKIVVAPGDTVILGGGGQLESLAGSLRIRERKDERIRHENKAVGALVYVEASGQGDAHSPAHFQVSVSLTPAKFDALLKVALAGQLPTRFYVHAGERASMRDPEGIGYVVRDGERIKLWDNKNHRTLPIVNFSVVLPIAVAEARPQTALVPVEHAVVEVHGGSDQVAEIADQLAVFQGETKNALTAVVSVVAVIGVLLLLINLVLIIR